MRVYLKRVCESQRGGETKVCEGELSAFQARHFHSVDTCFFGQLRLRHILIAPESGEDVVCHVGFLLVRVSQLYHRRLGSSTQIRMRVTCIAKEMAPSVAKKRVQFMRYCASLSAVSAKRRSRFAVRTCSISSRVPMMQ